MAEANTPGAIARAAADKLFKLPIQNTEHAHGEKDEIHRMMVHLAEIWNVPAKPPEAANDNFDINAIELGVRAVPVRGGGTRRVQVEARNRRSSAA